MAPFPVRPRLRLLWLSGLGLLSLALLLAGCGGPPRQAPTPLPPGTPIPQPTPVFGVPSPTPAAGAASEQTENPAAASSAEEALRARLATAVAQRRQVSPTPSPTPTPARPFLSSGRLVQAVVRPTALGIVGPGGATLVSTPGGRVLASLQPGDTLIVTGISPDGQWYAAFLNDGTAGWVPVGRLRLFGDEERLETVTDTVAPVVVVTMVAEASRPLGPIATVHATPLSTPPVAATPAPGSNQAPSVPASEPVPAGGLSAVVQVPRLNVRAGPGTDYPVLGVVVQDQVLVVRGRNPAGDWLQIVFPAGPEGVGWVYAPLTRPGGDVDVLPVVTPAATPAPTGNLQPGSGSDGLQGVLVFQERSGGPIYRYDLASGARQELTWGMDPAISPDGRTVAFVRGGGEAGVYLVGVDGTNLRRIFGGNSPRTPAWSPDGRYIVFSQVTGTTTCYDVGFGICLPNPPPNRPAKPVQRELRTLARIDVNGGSYRDLPSLPDAIAPSWGPNGIVYQSGAGLQITQDAPDGQTRTLIAEPRFRDPDVRADDGRLVFAADEGGHWEIFTANGDGSGVTALTRPPLLGEQPHNVAPAWSPDGRHIVFLSNRDGEWGLWVMAADGSNARQLSVGVTPSYAFQAEQVVDWGIP